MNDKLQISEAHDMLDRLGADGKRGSGSIRERLSSLLRLYRHGKPLPSSVELTYAHYGPENGNVKP